MTANTTIFKKALLLVSLVVLFAPLIQSNFKLLNLYKLAGDDGPLADTTFTTDNYFSGVWQSKMDKHIASDFGFRTVLIKLSNQINFNLFHKANAKDVIVGKDNYLFEKKYLDAYYGKDFMGEDSINDGIKRLKMISDKLLQLNQHLIVVIAPNKADYFKEFLPDENISDTKRTNYNYISKAFKENNIPCIDFNDWFIAQKDKAKYPLIPKHGNHWSLYGSYLAADSLISYIEGQQNIPMRHLFLKNITLRQPENEEKDIEYGINLFFKLKSFDLAYPEIVVESASRKIQPNVLVIGDSFYDNLQKLGITNCFNKSSFWYYNKSVIPRNTKEPLMVSELNVSNELKKYDVIIILATASNIKHFGWGFLKDAEKYLTNYPVIDQANFANK